MHLVVHIDTTLATASDRAKVYVNGQRVTAFSTANYPTQNTDWSWNSTGQHNIGRVNDSSYGPSDYLDGYLSEVNFIDGQALTPASFGQIDPVTGEWVAKKYTGTYGTNGFYLPFNDGSNLTNLCLDRSGNGNNWTANNIPLTAGPTYDWMVDVPALNGWGDRGNYCTLNPNARLNGTISNANLQYASSGNNVNSKVFASIGTRSGKWYFEFSPTTFAVNAALSVGVCDASQTNNLTTASPVDGSQGWGIISDDTTRYRRHNGSSVSLESGNFGTTSTYQIAFDVDGGRIWFGRDGVWYGSADPAAGTNAAYTNLSGELVPFAYIYTLNSGSVSSHINFGQRPFAYTPPSGFKALCTANLPAVSIWQPKKHFDAVTQLGSSVSTGAALLSQFTNFTADLAWGKDRTASNNHQLVDTVRGNTAVLQSNTTAAETTYTAPTGTDACVAWGWRAGGAAVANNAGSIASQVSANTTAGFSIVTYTGTGVAGTVGHGLGVPPKMVIVKPRTPTNTTDNWEVYHASRGNTVFLTLNSTEAETAASNRWNNTSPTSDVFSIGTVPSSAADSYVAYCFAEIPGFSKIGSYVGNGSADGPFVYCGFRPRFVLIKRSDSADNWVLYDTARNTYNVANLSLFPNSSAAEFTETVNLPDILSSGFKLRGSGTATNASGGNYIFMAFADVPFNFANAR